MIKTPILIVGAGPTGLMLSAQLHRYGAPHVIVDRKAGITEASKALAVQARTLEQYRQLGIADTAIENGFMARSARFIINGRIRANAPLGEIGQGLSPYPYLFILEQSRNEALLLDHISSCGGQVQWSTEVAELQDHSDGYAGVLKHHDGTSVPFQCQYLIGCGGASSPVRHFLNMPFPGATNEQSFFVADINLDSELEKHGLLLVINQSEFFAFFPMAGRNHYRAVGVLPPAIADGEDFPFAVLKSHIEDNLGFPAEITDHSWHSSYRVHHRIADSFCAGDAFLVGDAAHIHSPAGGQGMNTGLGDAVNLGWKLAAVVNGWTGPAILRSYNEERRPFGVRLVHTTDRAFSVMVSKSAVARFARTRILPYWLSTVLRFNKLRRLLFKTISQTVIDYRRSPLSDGSGSRAVRSGDRFPWFEWEGGNSFEWLANVGYVVLRFDSNEVVEIPDWNGPVTEIDVPEPAAAAAAKAGLSARGIVTVRPDMHVAHVSPG